MIKTKSLPSHALKSLLGLSVAVGLSAGAHAVGIEDVVDGGNSFSWEQVELPGAKCSDGSQYKFWVYDNPNSNDMVISYEGGGACWDYESCSGALGLLGAANPNGLADSYITETKASYVAPILNGNDPGLPFRSRENLPTNGWDAVYMPYCTGDVHVGNNVQTYEDPTGVNPPILFHHMGYSNSTAAMDFLNQRFDNINRVVVTGFSAGGVASSALYHEIRQRMDFNKGFMLNDSGPLFPAPDGSYNSKQLHQTITAAWDLPSVLVNMPAGFDVEDMGTVNTVVADLYPQDSFAYTGFSTDFNFSRFSYERFFPGIDQNGILTKWRQDQNNLVAQMNSKSNFSYIIPWNRPINVSHCSTIITFLGSHACPSVRKKRWYEVFEFPWDQSWKCPGTMYGMTAFLDAWIGGSTWRLIEPKNNYNLEDPGMKIYGPLIDDAI
jgi:Pectinacetylesterase